MRQTSMLLIKNLQHIFLARGILHAGLQRNKNTQHAMQEEQNVSYDMLGTVSDFRKQTKEKGKIKDDKLCKQSFRETKKKKDEEDIEKKRKQTTSARWRGRGKRQKKY